METVNIKSVSLDIRQEKFVSVDFFQNDTNIIKFIVSENGVTPNLSNVDEIMVNYKRPDGEIISRLLESESNIISYQLGQAEMAVAGTGKLVLQFFRSDDRLSSFTINVSVKKSIEANFDFEEVESGLVDQLFERINSLNERLENIVIEGGGEQVVKSEVVETTEGKPWSTTITEATATLGGIKQKVVTKPLNTTKRIVLFGSSSIEGVGVTNPSNSFANRLSNRLSSRGYEVVNRGISGDNTLGAIARFFKDVVPLNPDFVIFGFTIGNEGMYSLSDKAAVYEHFRNNMFKLIHMTKKFGAVPIVLTQAPTQDFTNEIYNYSKKLQEELDESGVLCIDWGGVVDDLSGRPFANAMSDAWHYNDASHKEICNAIPPSLFEKAAIQRGGNLQPSYKGSVRFGAITTATPIHFVPTDEITTFTFFARFKIDTGTGLCALVSFTPTERVFTSGNTGTGAIAYANSSISDFPIDDSKNFANDTWFSLAVTYSPISGKMRFYIDGVFKSEATLSMIPTRFTIGGREGSNYVLKTANVKDVAIYRTRLKDYQIAQLHGGLVSQTSLEIYSPMNDKTIFPNGKLVNLAGTTSNFVVNAGETGVSSSD